MSLFQLYETQRKPFNAGKKWICINPSSVGFPTDTRGEIIEIIWTNETYCRYKILCGNYRSREYQTRKTDILKAYEPYTMETISNA
jgi:hypothetical protein